MYDISDIFNRIAEEILIFPGYLHRLVCIVRRNLPVIPGFRVDKVDRLIVFGETVGNLVIDLLLINYVFFLTVLLPLFIFFDKYVDHTVGKKVAHGIERQKRVKILEHYKYGHDPAGTADSPVMDLIPS